MRTKDSAQVAEIVRLNKEIAKLRTTLEDVQARLVDEGPAIGEGNSDSGRGPVSPETGDPFPVSSEGSRPCWNQRGRPSMRKKAGGQ